METFWQYAGFAGFIVMLPVSWLQVVKNYRRKSTEGLSTWMFVALFIGLTLMFLTAMHDGSGLAIVFNFGVGALGSLIVLCQIYWYRRKKTGGVS